MTVDMPTCQHCPTRHLSNPATDGNYAARGYCTNNFLSPSTMVMIDGMRQQLTTELTNRKLIRCLEGSSLNSKNHELVRCVLV